MFVTNCHCAETDYECDVHYARKQDSGPCLIEAHANVSVTPPDDCPSGTYYEISNGYRKVVGDTCIVDAEGNKGLDRNPSKYLCPHWSSRVSHGGWVVLFVIMMLVIAMAYMTYNNKGGAADKGAALLGCCRDRLSKGAGNYRYDVLGAGGQTESAVDYEHYDNNEDIEDGFGLDDDDDQDEPTLMDKHAAKPSKAPMYSDPVPAVRPPEEDLMADDDDDDDDLDFNPREADGDAI